MTPRPLLPLWIALVVAAVVTVALSIGLATTVLRVARVPSGAMEQTLPVGASILVDHRRSAGVHGGSLVVIRESVAGRQVQVVKRVIATGGETIACCSPTGAVLVNGKPLVEPYVFEDDHQVFCDAGPGTEQCPPGAAPLRVPPGRLFVMGDHRAFSSDSRARLDDQHRGTVAADDVIGTVSGPFTHDAAYDRIRLIALAIALPLAVSVGLLTELAGRRRR